jgi:hypothetical protein
VLPPRKSLRYLKGRRPELVHHAMFKASLIVLLSALAGIAGWWTYVVREEVLGSEIELEKARVELVQANEQLEESRMVIEEKSRHIQELRVRLALLKIDHRAARIEVVSQEELEGKPGVVQTTIRFIEYDREGNPVGAEQELTIEGTRLYLESLVIKFEDDYVEAGEFLRGTSLCLFNRVFSERVAPVDGVAIDRTGTHPNAYSPGDSEDEMFQAELWERFWEYANDPEAAAEKGVRAIHGEAPFMEVRPGRTYEVELRSSGGLSIRAH